MEKEADMIEVAEHGITARNVQYTRMKKAFRKDSSPELMIRLAQRKRYARKRIQRLFYKQFGKIGRNMFPQKLSPALK